MFAETRTDVGADVPLGGAYFALRREEDKMKFDIPSFEKNFLFNVHQSKQNAQPHTRYTYT